MRPFHRDVTVRLNQVGITGHESSAIRMLLSGRNMYDVSEVLYLDVTYLDDLLHETCKRFKVDSIETLQLKFLRGQL